ncbi:MAG: formate dehydrogenase accessory protein FdhE [Pseudomonadota bacterium]
MTSDVTLTSDQIKQAVATLKTVRPAYKTLLDFYEQIFLAQEDTRRQVEIDPIRISEKILSIKAKEKLPLISMSEFRIDSKSASLLLKKICGIANGANKTMAASAKALLNALEEKKLDPDLLFSGLIEENDTFYSQVEEKNGIDKKILAFLIYSAIQPSLVVCAEQLSTYLPDNEAWEKGYCPICGSVPGLSVLEGEGERFLFCGFCWHKWQVQRLYCPFCENKDSKTLHYFFSEEEKELRVNVCDSCKKYIKTIDARKTERIIYPPLEQVSTLHLDIQAREKGLESGAHLSLQT